MTFALCVLMLCQPQTSPEKRTQQRQQERIEPGPWDAYNEITVGPRLTIPGGKLSSETTWGDAFDSGAGFEAQYSHLWRVSSKGAYLGLYGGLSFDQFGGQNFTDSSAPGVTFKPDSMGIFGLEVGARLRQDIGAIFLDANLGVGPVFYPDTGVTLSGPGGSLDVDAIDRSTEFLFTVGFRVGVIASKQIDLAFGVNYQRNGAPQHSDNFQSNFKAMENVVLSLTLDVNF